MKSRRLEATDEVDWDQICEELKAHFNSNDQTGEARRALAKLVAGGCDERSILQNLYLFCGSNPHEMKALRARLDFPGKRKRILGIARLLLEASSEIRVAEGLLEDLGFITFNVMPDTLKLEQYAKLLSRVGEYAKWLASGKISGRDHHLVSLCWMTQASTGRPHYAVLADLVNATTELYDPGPSKLATEESIRKRVSLHRKLGRTKVDRGH